MEKMVIQRFISEEIFEIVKRDFNFLVKKVIDSGFEYDLQIRDNYFNLYFRGNSIGKIICHKSKEIYTVEIHKKFICDKMEERFPKKPNGQYWLFDLDRKLLPSFFSSNNLSSMANKVKKVNFKEEIAFEQMIITDNVDRSDFIIIDRQIADTKHPTKMDLLALVRKKNTDYQFCVLEVKLGNNSQLRGHVIGQLEGYKQRIIEKFPEYKECYEMNFKQKHELGLLRQISHINIVPGVMGIIVIGGYSGIAKKNIEELKKKAPKIKIIQLKNRVDLEKAI